MEGLFIGIGMLLAILGSPREGSSAEGDAQRLRRSRGPMIQATGAKLPRLVAE